MIWKRYEATEESVTFALHVVERKYVTVLRAKNLAGGLVRGDTKITSRKRWGRLWFPFPSPPFASEASKSRHRLRSTSATCYNVSKI